MYRLVALDLDGTLVDSAPDLCHCLGHSLDSAGFDRPSLADVRRWIGDGIEMLVRRALAAAQGREPDAVLIDETLTVFKQCYQRRLFVSSRLYPGVAETLQALRSAGLTLGCVTNKPEAFARELLDRAGIGPHFDFVHGADSFATKKPSPEPLTGAAARFGIPPHEAVMIGDARNDLESARSAGFDFVFAAYGYAPAGDSALSAHETAIDDFSALRQLLCE